MSRDRCRRATEPACPQAAITSTALTLLSPARAGFGLDVTRNISTAESPGRKRQVYASTKKERFNKQNTTQAYMTTKVAVCQVPDISEDVTTSLGWIEKFAEQAEVDEVSVVCFPECFLQGYLTDKHLASKYAVDLTSSVFKSILQRLAKYNAVLVFGLIEREAESLYNTAVVIKQGKLIGKYRKTHLLEGEKIFKTGHEYPVFQINDLKFGINICYDTQFSEAAENVSKQGATLILCPSNNMMRYETAEKYKHLHHKMRIERVTETGVWLMSADVTGERDGRISYGPTSVINPYGQIVAQVPLMETGMITVDIK